MMRIRVNLSRCTGHAHCAANAPHIFLLDDYGNCASDGQELESGQVEEARAAALACPEQAIEIFDAGFPAS